MNDYTFVEKTLLERAYDLIAKPPRLSDHEGDGGVHPNDYRAVVKEWVRDYEKEVISKLPAGHDPGIKMMRNIKSERPIFFSILMTALDDLYWHGKNPDNEEVEDCMKVLGATAPLRANQLYNTFIKEK